MLYLFCVTFDGEVEVTDYNNCVERAEASDRTDRSKYRDVIKVNGSYNFCPCEPSISRDACDG